MAILKDLCEHPQKIKGVKAQWHVREHRWLELGLLRRRLPVPRQGPHRLRAILLGRAGPSLHRRC
eukprot:2007956-Alexandrium_andersonii.AAC.1